MAENDPNKLPDPLAPSGLELDFDYKKAPAQAPAPAAAPPPAPAATSGPRAVAASTSGSRPTISNPRMQAVRSASRLEPVPERPREATSARLREGAIDTLFNSASILADVVDDFRSSDRFFKYKAAVLGTWLFLTVSSFMVACPGQGPSNDIGAKLVIGGEATRPIYMVKNESLTPWLDVNVVVNDLYRSTMGQVEANGGSITLSAAVLFDETGQKAPPTLRITDIVVHVTEPEGDATLLKGGTPLQ